MIAAGAPKLVLNGSALANPYVGQGAYALRLIQALQHSLDDEFVVILPYTVTVPAGFEKGKFLYLPQRFAPKHELLTRISINNQLLRFVCNEFPDAVFHSPGPIAGGKQPRRTAVTIHDCIYRSFPNYLGRFLVRRVYMHATERFARKASLVLTDSDFSKNELITKIGIAPDRIEVLYPWVGREFLFPISYDHIASLRKRRNLPERFWLYLGGYDYRKNVELLLNAYATVARIRSVPPLILAGVIPSQPSRVTCDVLGTLKHLHLNDSQIQMPGPISVDELPALYKATSLLIYPSLMEGFGLPPAEAMAVGTPVLASNASSLPEVVQNRACLFDPVKIDDLVEKLNNAADNEQRFRAKLSDRFTEVYGVKRYLDLVNRLAQMNVDA